MCGFTTYFNAIFFLLVGVLVDRTLLPEILIGGALYGFVYMVPIAVTDFKLRWTHAKIEEIQKEPEKTRKELKELGVEDPEDLEK